jgi:hypothetical protein
VRWQTAVLAENLLELVVASEGHDLRWSTTVIEDEPFVSFIYWLNSVKKAFGI